MNLLTRAIDLAAYDERGMPVLLARVNTSRDTSEVWAAQFRRNILSHGTVPPARFFLIATQERLYFWRQDDPIPDDAPPQFTLDATGALKSYFERAHLTPEDIGGEALEMIILWWLDDIAVFRRSSAKRDPALRWLAESGLLDALGRARLIMNEQK